MKISAVFAAFTAAFLINQADATEHAYFGLPARIGRKDTVYSIHGSATPIVCFNKMINLNHQNPIYGRKWIMQLDHTWRSKRKVVDQKGEEQTFVPLKQLITEGRVKFTGKALQYMQEHAAESGLDPSAIQSYSPGETGEDGVTYISSNDFHFRRWYSLFLYKHKFSPLMTEGSAETKDQEAYCWGVVVNLDRMSLKSGRLYSWRLYKRRHIFGLMRFYGSGYRSRHFRIEEDRNAPSNAVAKPETESQPLPLDPNNAAGFGTHTVAPIPVADARQKLADKKPEAEEDENAKEDEAAPTTNTADDEKFLKSIDQTLADNGFDPEEDQMPPKRRSPRHGHY